MEHSKGHIGRTLLIAATGCAFALGAANAYAAGNGVSKETVESRMWVQSKTEVSENPLVIRVSEPLPTLVVPLTTKFEATVEPELVLTQDENYQTEDDFSSFDLVEDSPIFVGVHKDPEFDTREALREKASYNKSLNIDPAGSVAGAGLITKF